MVDFRLAIVYAGDRLVGDRLGKDRRLFAPERCLVGDRLEPVLSSFKKNVLERMKQFMLNMFL